MIVDKEKDRKKEASHLIFFDGFWLFSLPRSPEESESSEVGQNRLREKCGKQNLYVLKFFFLNQSK